MAAMVAPSQNMWEQRRPGQVIHMGPVPTMSNMIPTTNAPSSSRPYGQPQLDLQMPMYPQTTVSGHIPFQQPAYSFDVNPMPQYPVHPPQQPPYVPFQAPPVQTPTSYAPTHSDISAPVPLVRDARNALPSISRSSPIKTEVTSPAHANASFSDNGQDASKSNGSESGDAAPVFSTDVDCLMRAIQAKQTATPAQTPTTPTADMHKEDPERSAPMVNLGSKQSRKKYHCTVPGCHKSFFQKTHLEIHNRAHTGIKPFVSRQHLNWCSQ